MVRFSRLFLIFTILASGLNLFLLGLTFWRQPVAVVVPHHNVVKDKRREFLKLIARQRSLTKNIIIIGPDHFSPSPYGMYFTDADWNLASGKLEFAKELGLSKLPELRLRDGLVKNDHAIFNLLPDIKAIWPRAKIFPILLGQKLPASALRPLVEGLVSACGRDCLIMASVDFSHYLSKEEAEANDQKTLAALVSQDPAKILAAKVDSPQSLFLMSEYSRRRGANRWFFFARTFTDSTSHIFGGYQRLTVLTLPAMIKAWLRAISLPVR